MQKRLTILAYLDNADEADYANESSLEALAAQLRPILTELGFDLYEVDVTDPDAD